MPLNGVKGSNNGRQTTKGRVIYSVGTIVVLFWVGLLFVIFGQVSRALLKHKDWLVK